MCVVCVLCLIVVPLPPGENPFAVKINIYLSINNSLTELHIPNITDKAVSSQPHFQLITLATNSFVTASRTELNYQLTTA
jgi:type III secretory pathway component EscV